MSEFKFFNMNRVYNELYYQFPKVLIASDKYKKMSDSTKIAYMLLKARLELAVQKNQIDEKGNVYFTFTISELGEVIGCGKQKVLAIKSQLEEFGLLYQKQMGFNKQFGKNNPNRLYLAELEVTENDIYQLHSFDETMNENADKSEGMKIIPTPQENKNAEFLGTQEGMKIIPSQNVDKSEGMKINTVFNNLNQNTDTRDTKDTQKEQIRQQILLDQFAEVQENTFLNKKSLELIAIFSDTIEEAHAKVGFIIKAKAKVENKYNQSIVGEHCQEDIESCLRRVMHKIKTDSSVKSPEGLFFMSFVNLFEDYHLKTEAIKNNPNLSNVITHNWVTE